MEDEKQKKLERAKRFGIDLEDEDEKKKKRKDRFGPINDNEVMIYQNLTYNDNIMKF